MAEPFLNPPKGPTQIRASRLDEGADTLGNVAGNDPNLMGQLAQMLLKLREPLSVASMGLPSTGPSPAIAPFLRGIGGEGMNMAMPSPLTRFKPQQVEGMLGDITKGRQDMIVGKRIVSDDAIATTPEYGRTWTEIQPLIQGLDERLAPLRAMPFGPHSKQRTELSDRMMSLYDEGIRRERANLLAAEDPSNIFAKGTTITERSFLDGLIRDALMLFMGGKAPTQKDARRSVDLTPAQQSSVGGRD